MPSTETRSSPRTPQLGLPPKIEFGWGSYPVWGFDPAPSVAPTVTVGNTSTNTSAATAAADLGEQDPFSTAKAKLADIRKEGTSELLSKLAEKLLAALAGASLVPARVVNTAGHEIAFLFFGSQLREGGAHHLVATIICSEDGLSAMLQDRETQKITAWDLETEQVSEGLERVRDFIAGR